MPEGRECRVAAYEAFAEVYDALMDDVDYDGWARRYLDLLALAGVAPRSLCDCACGTGALSVRFAEAGIRVTGADLSGAMLARAQEKARRRGVQAMFIRQDMRALELPRPVDAIVCGCDGLNYLMDDEGVRAFFGRARASIRPGGALAFDISSAWKLEHTLGDGFFGEDRDDVTYLWSNRFDPRARTLTMDLTFFVRRPDGLYRRFDETHVQRAHEADDLRRLLTECGFRDIRIFGDRKNEPPAADAPRIFFLAVRE